MLEIVLYFHVHQPYRLKRLNLFDVGNIDTPFDDDLNRTIIKKVSKNCYIPTNNLLLKMLKQFDSRFKVAFSITGTAFEQFHRYAPEVEDLFVELYESGDVELMGETYFHSLSCLYDTEEFIDQVQMHLDLLNEKFGKVPVTFRNTELIYEDSIADTIHPFKNFQTILTEGADWVLKKNSPLNLYQSYNGKYFLMLKYYSLSDDIAFRFSNKGWIEYPLTAGKFISRVEKIRLSETKAKNQYLNLFMDYETFGEHQWQETGILEFLENLIESILEKKNIRFAVPQEICRYPVKKLSIPKPVSWADTERDLSAWLSNDIQKNAVETLYDLLRKIKQKGDETLLSTIRKLTTSDHLYYMCTKYFQNGNIHKYFSPYESPENAYRYFMFALTDIEEKLK